MHLYLPPPLNPPLESNSPPRRFDLQGQDAKDDTNQGREGHNDIGEKVGTGGPGRALRFSAFGTLGWGGAVRGERATSEASIKRGRREDICYSTTGESRRLTLPSASLASGSLRRPPRNRGQHQDEGRGQDRPSSPR